MKSLETILAGILLLGCGEDSFSFGPQFPQPKVYKSSFNTKEKYIPEDANNKAFYDAFGFGPYAVDHKEKRGDQVILALKRSSGGSAYRPGDITAAIPGVGNYRGQVWATYRSGTLFIGRSGSKKSFLEFTYDSIKNTIRYRCWNPEIVDKLMPSGTFPRNEGVSFCFTNDYSALINFDRFFKDAFGESPFPEERIFEAKINENPTDAINEIYKDIDKLKFGTSSVFRLLGLRTAAEKYKTLASKIKTSKVEALEKQLTSIYYTLADEFKEDQMLLQVKTSLGIMEKPVEIMEFTP